MSILRDAAAKKAVEYGLPKVRGVYIRRLIGDDYQITQVIPNPVIEETKYDLENMSSLSNLQGMARVLDIKGISKQYPRHELEAENIDYLVDSIDNTPDAPQMTCTLLQLTDNGLTWSIQVKQDQGQQEVYIYD
jgi:hypothetical protein